MYSEVYNMRYARSNVAGTCSAELIYLQRKSYNCDRGPGQDTLQYIALVTNNS